MWISLKQLSIVIVWKVVRYCRLWSWTETPTSSSPTTPWSPADVHFSWQGFLALQSNVLLSLLPSLTEAKAQTKKKWTITKLQLKHETESNYEEYDKRKKPFNTVCVSCLFSRNTAHPPTEQQSNSRRSASLTRSYHFSWRAVVVLWCQDDYPTGGGWLTAGWR